MGLLKGVIRFSETLLFTTFDVVESLEGSEERYYELILNGPRKTVPR